MNDYDERLNDMFKTADEKVNIKLKESILKPEFITISKEDFINFFFRNNEIEIGDDYYRDYFNDNFLEAIDKLYEEFRIGLKFTE